MSKKKEGVTRLLGPRTDPSAGFSPINFSSDDWDSVLGRFEPTGPHRFQLIEPVQKPNPPEPRKLDLRTLKTKQSPTIAILRQAIKSKGLTVPKEAKLKGDIEDFILANAEVFS